MNGEDVINCGTCTDFKDWMKKQQQEQPKQKQEQQHQQQQQQQQQHQSAKSPGVTQAPTNGTHAASTAEAADPPAYDYNECPLFRDQLGRAAWAYVHTMAANYPSKPSEQQKGSMSQFVHSFAQFFPCHECAVDFQEE